MKNTPATTCSSCLNFADIGQGIECLNMVSFKPQHEEQFRPATANDSCPDHDPREVQLMAHPDGDFSIQLVRGDDRGVLIVTTEDGSTVAVTLGGIGLIELGLDLARHGKQLIE